ncbi:MAG: flagellar biosynthetic protein FliO [Vulcanimicrobiaceae bacterium]
MDFALATRMLSALAVIVLVLFGLQAFARFALRSRLAAGNDRRLVHVIETTFLPNASSLHVLRIADRYVVVGRSGGHIAFLCDIPPDSVASWLAAQPASPIVASATLLAFVKRLRGRRV